MVRLEQVAALRPGAGAVALLSANICAGEHKRRRPGPYL